MDMPTIRDEVNAGVDEYLLSMKWNDTAFANLLKQKILQKFTKIPPLMENERIDLKELHHLHQDVVIGGVDKAKHNFGAICRPYYLNLLHDELTKNNTFTPWEGDQDTLVNKINKANQELHLKEGTAIPYLYGIMKRHKGKGVRKLRWIAGTSSTSNTAKTNKAIDNPRNNKRAPQQSCMASIHQETSGLLKAVMSALKRQDREEEARTGVRKYFIVESIDEVAAVIKQHEDSLAKLTPRTFDFSAMYSTIPQNHALQHLHEAITRAFTFMKNKRLQRPHDNRAKKKLFNWSPPNEPSHGLKTYTCDDVIKLVQYVIENSYVKNGGLIRKQQTGLPTGGNASSDIANIFCYNIEFKYISNLNSSDQKKYVNASRYIDDMLMWGTQPPPQDLYQMEYLETSHEEDKITFLGMMARIQRYEHKKPRIRLSVYNKELDWVDFTPLKYTSAYSTAPIKQVRGILTGAVLRANVICNNMSDFKLECQRIIYHLLGRGHNAEYLVPTWNTVIQRLYMNFAKELNECKHFFHQVVKQYKAQKPLWTENEFIGYTRPTKPMADTTPLPAMPSVSPLSKTTQDSEDMDIEQDTPPRRQKEQATPHNKTNSSPHRGNKTTASAVPSEDHTTNKSHETTPTDPTEYVPQPYIPTSNAPAKGQKTTKGNKKPPPDYHTVVGTSRPGQKTLTSPRATRPAGENTSAQTPHIFRAYRKGKNYEDYQKNPKKGQEKDKDKGKDKDKKHQPAPAPVHSIRTESLSLQSDSATPQHPPLKLLNLSNVCYINAAVQTLLPTFLSTIKNIPNSTLTKESSCMKTLISMLDEDPSRVMCLETLRDNLGFAEHFMEDMHEATTKLLDGTSTIWERWQGHKRTKIKLWDYISHDVEYFCNCGLESNVHQERQILEVAIPENTEHYTLQEIINHELSHTTTFRRDCPNKNCSNKYCQEKITSTVPPNLIVTLKRYANESRVKTPLKCEIPEKITINGENYALITAGLHQGTTIDEGHYTCLKIGQDKNTLLDDVRHYYKDKKSSSKLLREEGYILVFQRTQAADEPMDVEHAPPSTPPMEPATPLRRHMPATTPMTERHVATPDIATTLFMSPHVSNRESAPTPQRTQPPLPLPQQHSPEQQQPPTPAPPPPTN